MQRSGYKRYLLTLLMVILAFNFLDRLALGIVLQDIKIDLDLSDTKLGLLSGIAFALFYSAMGIPIARWVDHGNRATLYWGGALASRCAANNERLQMRAMAALFCGFGIFSACVYLAPKQSRVAQNLGRG